VIQKLQQTFGGPGEAHHLSSKRSYDQGAKPSKKGHSQSIGHQQNYDSARYQSLNQSANLVIEGGQSKERFQATQKVGKKSTKMVPGSGGSIVLPAGAGMQAGAQLKA
jgi:hypothetical protein